MGSHFQLANHLDGWSSDSLHKMLTVSMSMTEFSPAMLDQIALTNLNQ
jgi:hypothetical protein